MLPDSIQPVAAGSYSVLLPCCYERHTASDITGYDLVQVVSHSEEHCLKLCHGYAGCNVVVYNVRQG